MGTVEQDLAKYEAEIARADALDAARERAVMVEIQRISDLTVAELLRETDIVEGQIRDFCGAPPAALRQTPLALDLAAVIAAVAETNVVRSTHD